MCDDKRYKCPEGGCTASFLKHCRLIVHRRKHTGERPFVCDVDECCKSYTNIQHLQRHKCMVHEKVCEVMCKVEGCGTVCNNKYNLKRHHNQRHNPVNNAFTCAECSERFSKKRQLKQHIVSLHLPRTCDMCNITFLTLHLYNKHNSCHKTYSCDCGEVFDRWSLFCKHRRSSCTIKKIDHKCVICNKIFTTKVNLKVHSLVHLEESRMELYRCSYIDCKRAYKYKKNLAYHVAAFHENKYNDEIKCTMPGCDTILKTKKNLKQHLYKMHSNVPKRKKERRPRKDKGKPKKSMVSVLAEVKLPVREQVKIINKTNAMISLPSVSLVKCDEIPFLNRTINSQNLIKEIEGNVGCDAENEVQVKNCEITANLEMCMSFEMEHFEEIEQRLKQKFVSIMVN